MIALHTVRDEAPLIHCMTNSVVPEITANVLLAIGAAPAMIDLPEEAEIFAGVASGMLINVGNISSEQMEAMRRAAPAACSAGTPWVLDPVAVGALPARTALARELLDHRPTIIRGNASEIMGLAGVSAGGRGVDSTDQAEAAIEAAQQLREQCGAVVAISGATDIIVGSTITRLTGGHELMTKVIGTGCSLGATCAAFAAVAEDALEAAVSAHALFSAAGTKAAQLTQSPGSYLPTFLDALYTMGDDEVSSLVQIKES